MSAPWTRAGIERLRVGMSRHVERGGAVGLAWAVARAGAIELGAAGTTDTGPGPAVDERTIFRISSMTKPVTAVAALVLVEDGLLRLDDPVDDLLPELAAPRVLVDPSGPLDHTVPAARPVTLRDLLTFRFGLGMDFAFSYEQAGLARMAELGLGVGPPEPAGPPPPDEWMRRLGTVPLERQPGERWLYHTAADVLGVLVGRAAGATLDRVLHERIFDPLGMRDTGFSVPAEGAERFGPLFAPDPEAGGRRVMDPVDGQWSTPPAFAGGGAGLVSTLSDYLTFASMLADRGTSGGVRILSRPTVELMTTNHLTPGQLAASAPGPDGDVGWGFGVSVRVRRRGLAAVGSYGWDGGLGTSWANDPAEDLVGVLLTNQAWTSPQPPAVCVDFWTSAYAAVAD